MYYGKGQGKAEGKERKKNKGFCKRQEQRL